MLIASAEYVDNLCRPLAWGIPWISQAVSNPMHFAVNVYDERLLEVLARILPGIVYSLSNAN